MLAEVLFEQARPALVVGCFSTALFTASTFYGLPVARTGTELLLDRLTPYQNSNRVPPCWPTPCCRTSRTACGRGRRCPAGELGDLVTAVGFCMQPQIYPSLRPAAERYLSKRFGARTRRYFKRRRLTALALPGGVPERLAFLPRNAAARRVARRARALKKAVHR